jgi:hypothetical protein
MVIVLQNASDEMEQFCCNRLCIAISIGAILIGGGLFVIPMTAVLGFLNLAGLPAAYPVTGTVVAYQLNDTHTHTLD